MSELHRIVAEFAATAPQAPAVVAEDASLTYGELLARADELAARLDAAGVRPGALVGLCLPSSADLVVGALAILRAGATYVALDPAQPANRIAGLLESARVAAVLDADGVRAGVGDLRTVDGDLAYVVYTSGSTGTPKGVLVPEAGVVNLARWHQRAFGVTAGTRCSQLGGPGFDAAAWEIWGALTAGATLYPAATALKTDPGRLRDWLVAHDIEVAFVPTPVAEAVLALDWPADPALRHLLTGGDRLHRAPRAGLGFELVNNYGVSEASVVTTSGRVAPGTEGNPSIGAPIDGVDIAVVEGELHVGGVSVARGYLDEPELTAARFVALPGREGRWYRTGDRVRENPDGTLDYLDRVDEQVQIRGTRVEPGEIVAALDRHPAVQRSVVLPVGDTDPRLVAFVQGSETDDLLADLAQWLPAAMLPSQVVWVDEVPLTGNGKIDRDALLAALPSAGAADGNAEKADEDEVGVIVADLIAGLLGRESVGPDEDFLLLGGHSLLGAQLVTRLADTFGVEISLRDLFDRPTAAGMADLVRTQLVEQVMALDDETAASLAAAAAE